MSLLLDLQRANFLRDFGDGLKNIASLIYIQKFKDAIDEQQSKEASPIPREELVNRVTEDTSFAEQETAGTLGREQQNVSGFPEISTGGIPDLMRQFDLIQSQIKARSDIVGKFIPSIALLNPQLANQLAEEALAGKKFELSSLKEKADLISAAEAIRQREQAAREATEQRREAAEEKIQMRRDYLREKQREFNEKMRQEDRHHDDMMRYRYDALKDRLLFIRKMHSGKAVNDAFKLFTQTTAINQKLQESQNKLRQERNKYEELLNYTDKDSYNRAVVFGTIKGGTAKTEEDFQKIYKSWQEKALEISEQMDKIQQQMEANIKSVEDYATKLGLTYPDVNVGKSNIDVGK